MTTSLLRKMVALTVVGTLTATACGPEPGDGAMPGALEITTEALHAPNAVATVSAVLSVDGASGPVTWSVDPTTPLPSWATLSSGGVVSGTRGESAPSLPEAIVVHATDGTSSDSALIPIVFIPVASAAVLSDVAEPLPEGTRLSAAVLSSSASSFEAVRADGTITPLTLAEVADEQLRQRAGKADNFAVAMSPTSAVRDRDTGAIVSTFAVPGPSSIRATQLSPDGAYLAVGAGVASSSAVHVFDAATGTLIRSDAVTGATSSAVSLAWKPDSSGLVAAGGQVFSTSVPAIFIDIDPDVATTTYALPGVQCSAIGWAITEDALFRCDGDIVAVTPDGNVTTLLASVPAGVAKPAGALCPTEQRWGFSAGSTMAEVQAALSPSGRYLAVVEACTGSASGFTFPYAHRLVYVDLLEAGGPTTLVPLSAPLIGDPPTITSSMAFVYSWT